MKTISIFLVLITAVIVMNNQHINSQPQQQEIPGINPRMKIVNDRNTENTVSLGDVNINIKVIGQIAITTLEFTYYNSSARILEGEFSFPLGNGQTISGFALDINGSLREGVVVEKEKGRKTFEAIVRKQTDPGLLEQTEGNNFRSRVYPIPANGSRKVVIAFEQELIAEKDHDVFLLPLNFTEKLRSFSIHAEIVKRQVKIDGGEGNFKAIHFNKWNDSWVADFEAKDYMAQNQIALKFPRPDEILSVYAAKEPGNEGTGYFYVNIIPENFTREKVPADKITLLWDNSNSSLTRNFEKEMAVIDSYIKKVSNLTIDLIPFNINAGKPTRFVITAGSWNLLKDALKAMTYDGGTSLGNLDFGKIKEGEIWLFSDGIFTYGDKCSMKFEVPVYTLNSNLSANHGLLESIAIKSGGSYLDLTALSSDQALTKLCNRSYHFISSTVKEGSVFNMYPSGSSQFNKTFSMTGMLKGESAVITLNFGFGQSIVYSKEIEIKCENSDELSLIRRIWAEKKIAELSMDEDSHEEEITSTGKQFGIITRNTSLIVLENLEDYLQYKIVPPAEMQKEYFRILSQREKENSDNPEGHLENVVKQYNEQSEWWNKKFPDLVATSKSMDTILFVEESLGEEAIVIEDRVMEEVSSDEERNVSYDMVSLEYAAPVASEYLPAMKSDDMQADILLNAWDPNTPYFKVLQYAAKGSEYETYLKLKKEYGDIPSFYTDAADFFAGIHNIDTAVLILSNLAELKLEVPPLLRTMGKKLLSMNRTGDAMAIFRKILKLRGEEPQSYRDLALACEADGNYQEAISILYEVVKREWDSRFPDIEVIAMNEINNVIARHSGLKYDFIDKRLIRKEPVDIRVVLTWDTDNCDMDLWVTEPSGEKCFYSHSLTRNGGKISHDFTAGYGPEEYMIRNANEGEYVVQANYYGTRSQSVLAPVNLHLDFYTHYGFPDQEHEKVVIRLENQKEIIDIAGFTFAKPENLK